MCVSPLTPANYRITHEFANPHTDSSLIILQVTPAHHFHLTSPPNRGRGPLHVCSCVANWQFGMRHHKFYECCARVCNQVYSLFPSFLSSDRHRRLIRQRPVIRLPGQPEIPHRGEQNRAGKQASTFSVSITDASQTFGPGAPPQARHPGQFCRFIIIIMIWTNFHILRQLGNSFRRG